MHDKHELRTSSLISVKYFFSHHQNTQRALFINKTCINIFCKRNTSTSCTGTPIRIWAAGCVASLQLRKGNFYCRPIRSSYPTVDNINHAIIANRQTDKPNCEWACSVLAGNIVEETGFAFVFALDFFFTIHAIWNLCKLCWSQFSIEARPDMILDHKTKHYLNEELYYDSQLTVSFYCSIFSSSSTTSIAGLIFSIKKFLYELKMYRITSELKRSR